MFDYIFGYFCWNTAEEFEAFKSGKKKSKKNKFKPDDDAVNESNGDSIQPPPGNSFKCKPSFQALN